MLEENGVSYVTQVVNKIVMILTLMKYCEE